MEAEVAISTTQEIMSGNKHIIHSYEFCETNSNLDKAPIESVYFSREMFRTIHHVFKKDKNQDFKIHIELINSSCNVFYQSASFHHYHIVNM